MNLIESFLSISDLINSLYREIKPAFIEEAEKCRWSDIHTKRKEKGNFNRVEYVIIAPYQIELRFQE